MKKPNLDDQSKLKKWKGGLVSSISEGQLKMKSGDYTIFRINGDALVKAEVNPLDFLSIYPEMGFYVFPTIVSPVREIMIVLFAPDGLSVPLLQLHPEWGQRLGKN